MQVLSYSSPLWVSSLCCLVHNLNLHTWSFFQGAHSAAHTICGHPTASILLPTLPAVLIAIPTKHLPLLVILPATHFTQRGFFPNLVAALKASLTCIVEDTSNLIFFKSKLYLWFLGLQQSTSLPWAPQTLPRRSTSLGWTMALTNPGIPWQEQWCCQMNWFTTYLSIPSVYRPTLLPQQWSPKLETIFQENTIHYYEVQNIYIYLFTYGMIYWFNECMDICCTSTNPPNPMQPCFSQ